MQWNLRDCNSYRKAQSIENWKGMTIRNQRVYLHYISCNEVIKTTIMFGEHNEFILCIDTLFLASILCYFLYRKD